MNRRKATTTLFAVAAVAAGIGYFVGCAIGEQSTVEAAVSPVKIKLEGSPR